MNALELTIHPPAECICEPTGPEPSGYNWNCDVPEHGWAMQLVEKKRLTDSELAAEVNSAVFHEAECEVRGLRLGMRDPEHPGVDHWVHWNHEFGRRATILERFATLPHYDEPTPRLPPI